MGNLSNLYISQSFQSLAHLGTNTSLVPGTMTQLQDGVGQSLNIYFDGTNISSSGNIYGANITGSGASIDTGSLVSTSSFNAYTASNDTKWNTLGGQTGSYVTSAITASSLVTASVNLNTITFTKGDASTFNITVNTGSGGGGTTDITSLNAFTASQETKDLTLANVTSSLNTATASLFTSASLAIVTASVTNDDITFTKGDGSQFTIQVATGSFAISASFAETASFALNGGVTQILAGPNITVSPLSGKGQVTISSTGTGSGNFNTATGSYGSFYDTTTQINPVANTARSMSFNETAITNGVSISGSTNPFNTYIKTENAGVYNLQFSAQLDKTDGGSDDVDIWIRKNGIDLLDTATTLTLPTNNSKLVAAWNWFVQSAANDYYQIIWSSADTSMRLLAEASSSTHPGIPSVIATVNRVDQFLSNTGSFSGSFTGTFNGYNLTEFTTTSSFNSYTSSTNSRLTNIETTTASLDSSITNINTFTQSANQRIGSLEAATSSYVTSAITASSLVTASVNLNTITFTKGDASTFNITVNTGSGGGGTTDITSLNEFTASQNTKNTTLGNLTGSFATTGSNIFTGKQTINNDVQATGYVSASYIQGPNGVFDILEAHNGVVSGSAQIAALGFVSSAITASSLITASFSGNTLTFTKGDASTFGVVIPDVSGSTINTGSFATTGSNTFFGNQTIDASNKIGFGTTPGDVYINSPFNGVVSQGLNIINYSGGTTDILANSNISIQSVNNKINITGKTGVDVYSNTFISGALNVTGSLTASLQQGYVWVGDASGKTTTVATSSFGGTINTGSFATTGSNVFTGDQTLIDAAGNSVTLTDTSGSLMLVAKTFTSASAHLSGSTNTQVNLIFKNNNNTADTIISGSNNIFANPSAPTAGFKRYIGQGGNIILNSGNVPQISGSMQFSPFMTNNYFGGNSTTITMRGPVSPISTFSILSNNILGTVNIGSSAANNAEKVVNGLQMALNTINGTLNFIANREFLTSSVTTNNNQLGGTVTLTLNSSSVTFSNNTVLDSGFTWTNNYYTGSAGQGLSTANRNIIIGQSNSILTTGILDEAATTNQPNYINNLIAGVANQIFTNATSASANHSLSSTIIYGNNLIVSASSATAGATVGSAFFGRYGVNDGVKNRNADTIFAVGTGTGTGARKTGFLIDSGSNTFIEGTLNVSGSTTMTGSLILSSSNATELFVIGDSQFTGSIAATGTFTSSLQQGYVWVGNASGITTTVATSSFGGGGAAFPYTGTASISGSLQVTGSMSGLPNELSVSSNTASIDFTQGNFFSITLPASATTHFTTSNVKLGQTLNIQINQPAGASTGSVAFAPSILFAGGNDYQATATGSAVDLLTMIAITGSTVLATSIKNFL